MESSDLRKINILNEILFLIGGKEGKDLKIIFKQLPGDDRHVTFKLTGGSYFCLDDIYQGDLSSFKRAMKLNFKSQWIDDAEIRVSADRNMTTAMKGTNILTISIDYEKKMATLNSSDGIERELGISKGYEDGKMYVMGKEIGLDTHLTYEGKDKEYISLGNIAYTHDKFKSILDDAMQQAGYKDTIIDCNANKELRVLLFEDFIHFESMQALEKHISDGKLTDIASFPANSRGGLIIAPGSNSFAFLQRQKDGSLHKIEIDLAKLTGFFFHVFGIDPSKLGKV